MAAGDTLQSIAYQIWGDASFWYMIADANGLMGDETLSAGQVLTIPNKVHNSHNIRGTFPGLRSERGDRQQLADGAQAAKAPLGRLRRDRADTMAVVAIAVTPAFPGIGARSARSSKPRGGIAAAAFGSAVGQGVAVLTGIQSKFDWGAVAMAAEAACVGPPSVRLGRRGRGRRERRRQCGGRWPGLGNIAANFVGAIAGAASPH